MVAHTLDGPTAGSPADTVARRPLKRSEYHALIDLGMFVDEKVELLFGELSPMNPQKKPHSGAAQAFHHALYDALKGRASVQGHSPIVGAHESEPEPDIAVYDPADDDSDDNPEHVWLVIEIADSSRHKDLGIKAKLYALSAVPEYWVVDLQKEVVRVMRDPDDGEYRSLTTLDFYRGHRLSPQRFPDVELELDRLVPRRRETT